MKSKVITVISILFLAILIFIPLKLTTHIFDVSKSQEELKAIALKYATNMGGHPFVIKKISKQNDYWKIYMVPAEPRYEFIEVTIDQYTGKIITVNKS